MFSRIAIFSICIAMAISSTFFFARANPDYDRQDCLNRGGIYKFPYCTLPNPNENRRSNLPVGHIFSRNYGACSYDLLVAWVPQGGNQYLIEGWWAASPRSWFHLISGDNIIVHNPDYPLYYYARKSNGQSIRNLSKDRIFSFAGQSYNMTAQNTGLYQGKYWIEIVC